VSNGRELKRQRHPRGQPRVMFIENREAPGTRNLRGLLSYPQLGLATPGGASMVHRSISLPYKHVYRKTRQADLNSMRLKAYFVLLGMRALAHGDMDRVDLMTDLLVQRRLRHV
jgi:hypothetical protein